MIDVESSWNNDMRVEQQFGVAIAR